MTPDRKGRASARIAIPRTPEIARLALTGLGLYGFPNRFRGTERKGKALELSCSSHRNSCFGPKQRRGRTTLKPAQRWNCT